jgi:hypothetical protein
MYFPGSINLGLSPCVYVMRRAVKEKKAKKGSVSALFIILIHHLYPIKLSGTHLIVNGISGFTVDANYY